MFNVIKDLSRALSFKLLLTSCIMIASLNSHSYSAEGWDPAWASTPPPGAAPLKAMAWYRDTFTPWLEQQKKLGNPIAKGFSGHIQSTGDFMRGYSRSVQEWQDTHAIRTRISVDQERKLQEEKAKIQAALNAERARREAEEQARQQLIAEHKKAEEARQLEARERQDYADRLLAQAEQDKQQALEKERKAHADRLSAQAAQARAEQAKQQAELKHATELGDLKSQLRAQKEQTVRSFLVQGETLQALISKLMYQTFNPQMEVAAELAALTASIARIRSHDEELAKDKELPPLQDCLVFHFNPVNQEVFDVTRNVILELEQQINAFDLKYLSVAYYQERKDISKGVKSALASFDKRDIPAFRLCKEAIEETAARMKEPLTIATFGSTIHSLIYTLAPTSKTRYLESLIRVGEDTGNATIIQDLWGLVCNSTDEVFNQDCSRLRRKLYQLAFILMEGAKKPTLVPPKDEEQDKGEEDFTAITLADGQYLTHQKFTQQLAFDHNNRLLEALLGLEDQHKRRSFLAQHEEERVTLEKKKKRFLEVLEGHIDAKLKMKERLTQLRHVPLLKELHPKVEATFDVKIKELRDTQTVFKGLLSIVESSKFCSTHREEVAHIQKYFQVLNILQITEDYKISFEKLLPQEHVYKTLEKIQKATDAHQSFLTALSELKAIWPTTHSDTDAVIIENKSFIQQLLETCFLEGENYLTLPSERRAVYYQHALKVLGDDESLSTLTPAVRQALLKAHDAYKKAREAITKISPAGDTVVLTETTAQRLYRIKGFDLTLESVAPQDASSSREDTSVPPPSPLKAGKGSLPPPPPPPPPSLRGSIAKTDTKKLSPWQLEKQELQKWLDLYTTLAGTIESQDDGVEVKSKFAQQERVKRSLERVYETLEEIMKQSLSHFDSDNMVFDGVKERLEGLFPPQVTS
jgi:hypothetical protein